MGDSKLVNASIVFIAVVLLAIVLRELQSFLRPFVIAVILVLLFAPLVRWSRKKKLPFFAVLLGLAIILGLIITLIVLLFQGSGVELEQSLPQEEAKIQKSIDSVAAWLSQLEIGGKKLDVKEYVDPAKIGGWVSKGVKAVLGTAQVIIGEISLVILFFLFLVPSYEVTMKRLHKSRGRTAKRIKAIVLNVEESIRDYLGTKSLISLLTAVAFAIALWLFDVKFILVLALFTFILNFIPNVGSFIAVIIALVVYAGTAGFSMNLVWLAVLLTAIQFVFGNYLDPKISGTKLRLSPVLILISLFFWGWVWGVVGMFLAVPLMNIIKIIFKNIRPTKRLAREMEQ